MQLFLCLLPLQHIKRPVLQNKQVVVLRMAFRARKVLGTFEKRAPDVELLGLSRNAPRNNYYQELEVEAEQLDLAYSLGVSFNYFLLVFLVIPISSC